LADGYEVGCIEEVAGGDLVANGPLANRTLLARQHCAFCLRQAHGGLPRCEFGIQCVLVILRPPRLP
jgi:hypothetical protein